MSVLRAASLIAALTLVSKVVAFGRDAATNFVFGAATITDAYNIAYTLPGFALVMLGGLNGPFHSAVVSVLGKIEDLDERRTILQTLVVITAVVMGILSFFGILASPWLVGWLAPGLTPEAMALTVQMTQIMFPMFFLSGLIGISYGVLNLRQIYTLPSLSPAVASITIIAALLLWGQGAGPAILAWSTLVGAVGQLLLQLIPLVRHWRLGQFKVEWRHPGVAQALHLIVPAALSSTIGQVIILVHTFFASGLPEGSWTAFGQANRLQQLPLGTLLAAALVPLLPLLTQSATRNDDFVELRRQTNQGLRSLLVLTLPMAVLLSTLSEPFIRVLFERGAWNAHDTVVTAQILAVLNVSLVAYALRDLLVRVYYALGDSRTPFLTSFLTIALVFVGDYLLLPVLDYLAVAAVTSLVTVVNLFVLGGLLRRRIGQLLEPATWKCLGYVGLACLPLFAGGHALAWWVHGQPTIPTLFWLGGGGGALGVLYMASLLWFGLPEAQGLLRRVQSRLPKKSTVAV